MNANITRGSFFIIALLTAGLFIVGRLFGNVIFAGSWAFDHWAFVPWWYLVAWAVAGIGVVTVFVWRRALVDSLFESPGRGLIGLAILAVLLFIFRYNSFIYGGGNYQIAKLAQTETIIHRWYEFGALWIADGIYRLVSHLSFTTNTYAYITWKILGLFGSLLTLVAAVKLSGELSFRTTSRALLFIILFFGPQTLLYFNFVGYEPLLVAVIYWFILYAVRMRNERKLANLIPLWLVTIAGLIIHVSMLMLVPAAIYITFAASSRKANVLAFLLGLLLLCGLALVVYQKAYGSMEYGQYILFQHDHNLESNYGLFTKNHIVDMLQLIFLVFPQALVLLALHFTRRSAGPRSSSFGVLWLLTLSGLALVFMMQPLRGIALDVPIMTAFLAPMAPLLAVLISERAEKGVLTGKGLGVVAALAVLAPFSVLPVYSKIQYADGYLNSFLNKRPFFWYEGGTAVRDAYFYYEENPSKPNANRWDQTIPVQSQDFLDMRAANEYILAKMYPEALQKLYKLKTKNRYWIEPRLLIVTVQNAIGRFDLAKPEIDTCLMIEPYGKACLINLYRYYLNTGDIAKAIDEVNRAIKIYPDDNELKADLAIYLYRSRDFKAADSLAAELIDADTTLAYPYLIRGFIAELRNEPKIAIPFYEAFIRHAPDAEETPQIRKKLNKLVLDQQKKKK